MSDIDYTQFDGHTPEWEFFSRPDGAWQISQAGTRHMVVLASRNLWDDRAAESLANGRLMHAAPVLLKQCQVLDRWKAEALIVIAEWEGTWDAIGRPVALGQSKASTVVARVRKLESENAKLAQQVEFWRAAAISEQRRANMLSAKPEAP